MDARQNPNLNTNYPDMDPNTEIEQTLVPNLNAQQIAQLLNRFKVNILTPELLPNGNIQKTKFYTIKSYHAPGESYDVKRRFKDFEWLYETMKVLYYGHLLPRLPEKNLLAKFNQESEAFTEQRRRQLENFLNKIVKNNTFHNCVELFTFLTVGVEQWRQYKKAHKILIDTEFIERTNMNRIGDKIMNQFRDETIDQPVVENDQKILGFERQIKFIEEMTLSLLSQVEQLKNGQLGFIDHQGDIFVGSLPFIKNNEAQRQIHNAYGKTNGTHEHIKQLFDVLIADLQDYFMDVTTVGSGIKRWKRLALLYCRLDRKYKKNGKIDVQNQRDKVKFKLENITTALYPQLVVDVEKRRLEIERHLINYVMLQKNLSSKISVLTITPNEGFVPTPN